MAIEMIEEFDLGTQIKVIGVGGGGGNAVDHMIANGVEGVEFIVANTDAQALNRSTAHHLIQLGTTGLGAGAKPEAGRSAAQEAEARIRESIAGANMLFITAGLGGGTGTGAAPIIAKVAKEMGILTVGVVTKPFEFEGTRRMRAADAGLAELEANVDSLIVILNDKLLDVLGEDATQDQAFAHANDVLKNAVGGISDIIHIPGLVNAGRNSFRLSESRNAMNTIRRYAAEDAHVIYGTAYDESLGDTLRVTVIATGLSPQKAAKTPMTMVHSAPVMMRGTGTDGPMMGQPLGGSPIAHDYSALSTPSVWRNGRTAAAKVDALASNGMDEIEIPAFLRKQAD
jgi:cell division protein FtsZ